MGMEDYYNVLGVGREASKKEIKEAFRKLAMQYHPDKQSKSTSTSSSTDSNTKFRLISEAYQILVDDRNRADYNFRLRYSNSNPNPTYTDSYNSNRYGYGYANSSSSSSRSSARYGYGYANSSSSSRSSASGDRFGNAFRYLRTRSFLLNLSFACSLLSGFAVINLGRDLLWKKHNSGKSFEDAIHASSIHKMKKSDKHDK